jgi:hypothetical protein
MQRFHLGFFFSIFLLSTALFPSPVLSQTIEKAATYVSETDQSLSIRKATVLPIVDNVDGIYARPFESELIAVIQADHKWDYVDAKTVGPVSSPQDLESDPTQVMALGKTIGTDALIAGRVSKGPDGIAIKVSLFLSNDGKLLITEEQEKIKNFDLKNIQSKARELLANIRSRIPYQGLVLSRANTLVTLNLGKRDGVKKDQVVSAVQIIKVTRHPKFNFLINTEKEVLGKIKLRKVEDTLSFGDIVTEKERGAVRRFSKIAGVDFVEYPDVNSISPTSPNESGSLEQKGTQVAFGEKPKEWVPVQKASFGLVNVALGMGGYTMARGAQGSAGYSTSPYMSNIKLHGELWFNPEWQVEADMRQAISFQKVSNPRTGSTPSELNVAVANYALYFTYNWMMRDDFWGPKIGLMAGLKQFSANVDDTTPTAFSTMVYRGLDLGLRGSLPIDPEQQWRAGATFHLMVLPAVQEKPDSSGGAASNSVLEFGFILGKRIGQRIEATAQMDYEYYSTGFGSGGANASHKLITLYGGVSYMF